jgi:hypothetical protein
MLALTLLSLVVSSPVVAADRVPQQFVGHWCWDQKAPEAQPTDFEPSMKLGIFRRSRKCEIPEHNFVVHPDRYFLGEEAECIFLQIVSITRHGTHRIKWRCRQLDDLEGKTWIADMWISAPSHNKLAIQDVQE